MAVVVILGAGVVAGSLARADRNGSDTSFDSYSMAGVSMEPSIGHGERVTVRDIDGAKVDRGDVVVLEIPAADGDESRLTIKRVVAVAGDEIATTSDGKLLIDGELVDEPYLAPGTSTRNLVTQELPEGYVFVLGDNRDNSQDSRLYGAVAYKAIMALVET